jgi:hypothetical protein
MNIKFWNKCLSNNDCFELFLFFIGNGGSPHVIAEWILTSQVWAEHSKMEKRARQLDFIFTNKEAKANIWFYFDIYHSDLQSGDSLMVLKGNTSEHPVTIVLYITFFTVQKRKI